MLFSVGAFSVLFFAVLSFRTLLGSGCSHGLNRGALSCAILRRDIFREWFYRGFFCGGGLFSALLGACFTVQSFAVEISMGSSP